MLKKEIEREFLNFYLKDMHDAVECGFLFGSLAKGCYRPRHDIDVFLIFKKEDQEAMSVARTRYFNLHEKFRALPDNQYPGEFYTKSQIEKYTNDPIDFDLGWHIYDELMLDRLFVLEVLAGDKTAVFGNRRYIAKIKTKSKALLNEWRHYFNNQILAMSNCDVLKTVIPCLVSTQ